MIGSELRSLRLAGTVPETARDRKIVCMLCSGGLDHAGGIGRWAGYLVEEWKEHPSFPPLRVLDTRGHGSHLVGFACFARTLVQLLALACSGRLGVIHANMSIRGSTVRKTLVSWLARIAGVPLVIHLHGSGYDTFFRRLPAPARAIVKATFRSADRVVVLGDIWREFLVQEIGVRAENIIRIFNAVPAPQERQPAAERGSCHIVMLGRIGARKGVPELLAALASAELAGRSWRATLAGDGEVERFRARAEELGLGDRVVFTGWLGKPAAAQLLQDADLLVLPSHEENLPVSVVEALAFGVPVVTTPVGATPELVEDGVSGLLVEPGDAAGLASAIAKLIDDPSLRDRLGRAGHEVFRAELEIGGAAEKFARLYGGLLDR